MLHVLLYTFFLLSILWSLVIGCLPAVCLMVSVVCLMVSVICLMVSAFCLMISGVCLMVSVVVSFYLMSCLCLLPPFFFWGGVSFFLWFLRSFFFLPYCLTPPFFGRVGS